MGLSHLNKKGEANMVDISEKKITKREAEARGEILFTKDSFRMLIENGIKKGDLLGVARIAGIMGAKKTSDLIPLCHSLSLSKVSIDFNVDDNKNLIECICKVRVTGKTGVEMEALVGVNIALLTIYDMCKALDKSMIISNVRLVKKVGGKSGDYING